MAGVGVGGMIANYLTGNPDAQIANYLNGPNPSPMATQNAQQGPAGPSGQGGGGVQQQSGGGPQQPPQQPLAAAQVTQPDPGNQPNIAALMMQSHNRDVQSARLNYDLAGMAAAFRPHGQQNPDPNAGGYDDSLAEYDKIQQIMSQQMKADNEKSLLTSAELLGPAMGMKPGQAKAAVQAGVFGQILQTHFANGEPTTLERDYRGAQKLVTEQLKGEHPDWSPQQIQAEVNNRVSPEMLMPGINLNDQAYRHYAQTEQAAGRTPLNPIEWKQHSDDVTKNKDAAVAEYPMIKMGVGQTTDMVDTLLNNPKAALAALQSLQATTGRAANYPIIGVNNRDVETAARTMNALKSALTGENFKGFKNVRNLFEFQTLAAKATAQLDAATTEEDLRNALQTIKSDLLAKQGIAREQAGLPPKEKKAAGKPLPDDTKAALDAQLKDRPDAKAAAVKHFEDLGYDMSAYK